MRADIESFDEEQDADDAAPVARQRDVGGCARSPPLLLAVSAAPTRDVLAACARCGGCARRGRPRAAAAGEKKVRRERVRTSAAVSRGRCSSLCRAAEQKEKQLRGLFVALRACDGCGRGLGAAQRARDGIVKPSSELCVAPLAERHPHGRRAGRGKSCSSAPLTPEGGSAPRALGGSAKQGRRGAMRGAAPGCRLRLTACRAADADRREPLSRVRRRVRRACGRAGRGGRAAPPVLSCGAAVDPARARAALQAACLAARVGGAKLRARAVLAVRLRLPDGCSCRLQGESLRYATATGLPEPSCQAQARLDCAPPSSRPSQSPFRLQLPAPSS